MDVTKTRKILTITALLLVMAVIFYMSAQPADDSSSMSDGICRGLCQVFVPEFEQMPDAEQVQKLNVLSFWVRKGAHCFEYAVLGMLLYLTAELYIRRRKFICLTSFFCGIFYATTDEVHQYFVPGRSCELRDVMIDTLGVIIGIWLILLYKRVRKVL